MKIYKNRLIITVQRFAYYLSTIYQNRIKNNIFYDLYGFPIQHKCFAYCFSTIYQNRIKKYFFKIHIDFQFTISVLHILFIQDLQKKNEKRMRFTIYIDFQFSIRFFIHMKCYTFVISKLLSYNQMGEKKINLWLYYRFMFHLMNFFIITADKAK